jgi:hypothetical protein
MLGDLGEKIRRVKARAPARPHPAAPDTPPANKLRAPGADPVWFAQDHDVLVLPEHPEDVFLDYVTGLTGTDRSTLRVAVPPPGRLGDGLLTADRLTDPVFHDELRTVLARRTVDSVVAMSPHAWVSALARAIGAQAALSGGAFTGQGGGTLGGHGEMQSAPYYTAQIIPADLDPETLNRLIEGGRRMCVPLHAMGYRGMLSADAIVTPDRQVLYTEWNGRLTGSTHTYFILGDKVVGKDYASDRVLLEHVWPQGWATSSFQSTWTG